MKNSELYNAYRKKQVFVKLSSLQQRLSDLIDYSKQKYFLGL